MQPASPAALRVWGRGVGECREGASRAGRVRSSCPSQDRLAERKALLLQAVQR